MEKKYLEILNMPHHVSAKHPPMSIHDRAAQFAPFAALTGYDAVIDETARLTDSIIVLNEDARVEIDRTIAALEQRIRLRPPVSVCFFVPDERKSGGAYVTAEGCLKSIDRIDPALVLTDGTRIAIERILELTDISSPEVNEE